MTAPPPRSAAKTAALWVLSLASAAGLLWLASLKLPLWPAEVVLPRPALLAVAVALHAPYLLLRALRMAYVLDPLVRSATGGARDLDRRVLHGSGLVSFFVVMLLPFRLGELSRPILLTRADEPGVGMPESLSATAIERVVDGLLVVGLLFGGLALSRPPRDAEVLGYVRQGGQVMALAFVVGCLFLALAARDPARWARFAGAVASPLGTGMAERIRSLSERVVSAVAAVASLGQSVAFVAWSLGYWAVTVAQLWLLSLACGLPLSLPEAGAVVAVIGLAIQLPGGPAQAGSFQVGAVAALTLFVPESLDGGATTFVAFMYLLQLVGGAIATLPGLALLARARRHPAAGA